MPSATPRTAVLMITVWFDDEEPTLLRARMSEIVNLDSPLRSYATAHDAEGIVRATTEWLAKVQRGPE